MASKVHLEIGLPRQKILQHFCLSPVQHAALRNTQSRNGFNTRLRAKDSRERQLTGAPQGEQVCSRFRYKLCLSVLCFPAACLFNAMIDSQQEMSVTGVERSDTAGG